MNSIDLIKVFACVFLAIFLSVITTYLEIWFIKDPMLIIILEELVLLIPTLLLARTFIGVLAFSSISGLVFGLFENAMRTVAAPQFIILHLVTSLISGISFYPALRSENKMFLAILFIGIFASIGIHYFVNFYGGDFFLGLWSMLYIFE